jgi:hypothetical protein
VAVLDSHTLRSGFTTLFVATFETAGVANVGAFTPPGSIATVPVAERKITFEFCALAVREVQGPLQK